MAMLLHIEYPAGERAIATGYPVPGSTLIVQIIPRGPEAALYDEVIVDLTGSEPHRVLQVVGGPRRPTIRVRLELDERGRLSWMDARELEGWDTRESDHDPLEIWAVPLRDDLHPADLVRTGAQLVSG